MYFLFGEGSIGLTKCSDEPKRNTFADNTIKVTKKLIFVLGQVENTIV